MADRGIYKVIPSGVTEGGKLRATIMLSPQVSQSEDLATLPSQLVTHWRDKRNWEMQLRVVSVWVTGGSCVVPPAGALKHSPECIARSLAGKAAWGSKEELGWLDKLWTSSMVRAAKKPSEISDIPSEVWKKLDELLKASNGSTGLQAGSGLCKAPSPEGAASATASATPAPPPSEAKQSPATYVQTILPSRQSDLALLLESERALEICTTARWAGGDYAACRAEEEACRLKLEQSASQPPVTTSGTGTTKAYVDPTDADQKTLREQVQQRFDCAKKSVLDLYDCRPDPDPRPALAPWLIESAAVAAGRSAVTGKIAGAARSHRDANQIEADKKVENPREADLEKSVAQRYFAIQGSPALSRLFGLTVDLEIEPKDLNNALGLEERANDPATVVHLLIGVNLNDGGSKPVFTLARYRPACDKHFMPASRLELHWPDRNSLHPQTSQHEGVLVLGQKLETATKEQLGRFVLTSLDVPRATNGALDRIGVPPTKETNQHMLASQQARDAKKAGKPEEEVKPDSKEPLLASMPTRWARKTHSTAGLVLLDRGRAEQSLQQFAARTVHGNRPDCILLDSNDLLIGYRLDVGVPFAADRPGDFAWRSLMARNIQHGNGGPHAAYVSTKVPLLMGGSAKQISPWQRTLDDALLSLPARLVDAPKEGEPNSKDAYVEEVVAVWTGEPMAALCAAEEKDKEREAEVGAGEVVSLPPANDRSDRVPPPLRFGWPYRVGMRAVYAGGISLSVQQAKNLYDGTSACNSASRNTLALPARDDVRSGIRRFLRHERIASPFLLIHVDIASHRSTKMGYERSAHAIVRSTPGEPKSEYAEPRETWRIFVPPSVEMHFAAMHGVFDGMTQPKEGLLHMRFDAKNGGFPCITAKSVEGINGETFFGERTISYDQEKRGDAVYIEKTAPRPRPYFPDPAAGRWAVAVRYAGTNTYLEGPSVTKPFRKSIENYPDCRPLVLRIVREASPQRQNANPTLQQVVSVAPGVSGHVKGGVEMVLKLAPGEDFEVDVWCIPEAEELQELFAPLESIAALALLNSRPTQSIDNLMVGLEAMLPRAMVDIVVKYLRACGCLPGSDKLRELPLNDGICGLDAPGREIRKAIAAAFYETLCSRPINEIAAVQSLRVTHVTSQPVRLPAFEAIDSDRRFRICRPLHAAALTASKDADASAASVAVSAPVTASTPAASSTPTSPNGNAADGDTKQDAKYDKSTPNVIEYILMGSVHVDLGTTGAIEFRALATCPTTSAFDDPRRGRTARDRRNAAWPKSERVNLPTEAVFGFDVCTDGKVKLPMREITLLQIEDLAQPTPSLRAASSDGLWRLNMEDLTPGISLAGWGRVTSRHVFPDRKARRLRVRMIPRTRHEELMRTGNGVARFAEWLRPGEEPQAPKDPGDESAVEIWLPAGIRPSEPIGKTPIPAFDWEDLGTTVTRKTVIRIPLGRGWFSSGEGERLGIVVWPPGALDSAATISRQGKPAPARRQVPLPQFMDEDLGPGGKFVTRWGSDPTRPIDSDARVNPDLPGFLDPSAFRDISTRSGARFNVELVPYVHMPVRRDATTNSENPPVTMAVSLVTYEPLFDIETEQWYVDVALDHPFEAQPFVRLGLVRYQQHAPEDLQVSFPTVQWVQMLPERSAWMFTENEGKETSTWLAVEGLGPVDVSTDAANCFVGTRMLARVVTEYQNDAGTACRRVTPSRDMTAERKNSDHPAGAPYRGPRWRWTLKIDVDELDRDSKDLGEVSHYVYIEEREAYLPATYAKEPVSAEVAAGKLDPCEHVESGPRFSVRLPLQRPRPLKR